MVSADDTLAITADLVVDDIIDRWPATARVFIHRRMHCIGCAVARFESVADACRIYGQPLADVLAELRTAASSASGPVSAPPSPMPSS
jgi:hybrid cluster-associated redox disulfide protein